jgi:membrane protease YdiL (CAAX protease family)
VSSRAAGTSTATRGVRTRETFALRRPPSWPTAFSLILGALLATYLLGAWLTPSQGGQPDQGVPTFWDPSRLPQFALSFAAIVVVVPFVEELMCRGLGFALLRPFGERAAIVGTAVPFGLMHGFLGALPFFVVAGLALGWVRSRTGSVYPGMLMHGAVNATAVILSVSLGPPT